MGVTRKTMSLFTLGLIDWRSDKERIARSSRLTKEAVRKGNRQQASANQQQAALLAEQNQLIAERNAMLADAPAAAPAGWYPDPQRQARVRYWNGQQWTGYVEN